MKHSICTVLIFTIFLLLLVFPAHASANHVAEYIDLENSEAKPASGEDGESAKATKKVGPFYDGRFSEDDRFKAMLADVDPLRKKSVDIINERLGLHYVDDGTIVILFQDVIDPTTFRLSHIAKPPQARAGRWAGERKGITFFVEDFISGEGNYEKTFIHEMTHAVMREVIERKKYREIPGWVREGIAVYVEDDGEDRIKRTYAWRKYDKDPLLMIDGLKEKEPDSGYAEAYLAIKYMIETHGEDKFKLFIQYLTEGKSWKGALKKAFRESAGKLEKNAREYALEQIKSINLEGKDILHTMRELTKKDDSKKDTAKEDAKTIVGLAGDFLQEHPDAFLAPHIMDYYGKALLKLGEHEKAIVVLQEALGKYKGVWLSDDFLSTLGSAYYKSEMFSEAAHHFHEIVSLHPKSKHIKKALYFRGLSLQAIGDKDEAKDEWTRLILSFPKSSWTEKAKKALHDLERSQ